MEVKALSPKDLSHHQSTGRQNGDSEQCTWYFPGHGSPFRSQFSLGGRLQCLRYILTLVRYHHVQSLSFATISAALETEPIVDDTVAPASNEQRNVVAPS